MSTDLTAHLYLEPSRDAFARTYDAGTAQVVWTRLVADLETPVSAYLKLSDGKHMTSLLESVEGGAVRGRYSPLTPSSPKRGLH
jgi:anthranilate synthase component I